MWFLQIDIYKTLKFVVFLFDRIYVYTLFQTINFQLFHFCKVKRPLNSEYLDKIDKCSSKINELFFLESK